MDIINQKKPGNKKCGALHTNERNFIRDHVDDMSVEKMAEFLNRGTESVDKFIRTNKVISSKISDQQTIRVNLRAQLQSREYWAEIKKQFTKDELIFFAAVWVELMLQFREDVLYAEELEIKQYITLEILINRNMAERQKATQDVERLQKLLDHQYSLDNSVRDDGLVVSLESQLSFARTAIPAYATEYTKLLEKRQNVSKDLKATRDQRIKRIEDSKSSWAAFIKALEDEDMRERVGDDAELMKIAKDKARDRLSEYHTFVDGKIDQPIFNADTIDKNE